MPSKYPREVDSKDNLFQVGNSCVTKIMEAWSSDKNYLIVEDISLFSERGGFCTVYMEEFDVPVEYRSITFSYKGIDSSQNKIIGITPISEYLIEKPPGSLIVGNIMAEHRNVVVDAIINIQKTIGKVGTKDKNSLRWIIDSLSEETKNPKPFFSVSPERGMAFESFSFKDETFLLKPGEKVIREWDFGDGNYLSTEERECSHVYSRSGKYGVKLKVVTPRGQNDILVRNAVIVMGKALPLPKIYYSNENIIANETEVLVVAEQSGQINDIQYIWDIDDREYRGKNLKIVFPRGGVFRPFLKVVNEAGNINMAYGDVLNVVERNSLWGVTQKNEGNCLTIEEYCPIAEIWKENKTSYTLERKWEEAYDQDEMNSGESFLYTGGVSAISGTFSSYIFLNKSRSDFIILNHNCMTEVFKEVNVRSKQSGWTSCRLNRGGNLEEISNKVYLFFGKSNSSGVSLDGNGVDCFDMATEVLESFSLDAMSYSHLDSEVSADLADENDSPSMLGKRWRSAGYKDTMYVSGTDKSNMFSKFIGFSPLSRSWKDLGGVNIKDASLALKDCCMGSGFNGIYFISPSEFIACYTPSNDTWSLMSGSFLKGTDMLNKNSSIKVACKDTHPEITPGINNRCFYVCGFHAQECFNFNEITKTAKMIDRRPMGVLGASSIF